MAIIQPRIKKPFLIYAVYLKPTAQNAKTTSKGIDNISDFNVKGKFVQGSFINKKIVIDVKKIIIIIEKSITRDFGDGSSFLIKGFSFKLNTTKNFSTRFLTVNIILLIKILNRLIKTAMPNEQKNKT
jgi:hypothetical protein